MRALTDDEKAFLVKQRLLGHDWRYLMTMDYQMADGGGGPWLVGDLIFECRCCAHLNVSWVVRHPDSPMYFERCVT